MQVPMDNKHIQMLIVDDHTHQSVRRWLYHDMKVESLMAPEASQMFQHLASTWVDVMLLNVHRRPGFDTPASGAVSMIRETSQGADLPVFILTADATMEEAEQPFLYEIEGYLARPLSEDSLRRKVDGVLPKVHRRRESYFVRHFMSEYNDPDLSYTEQQKMARNLRGTSFYKGFVEAPHQYPSELRTAIAKMFHAVFNDMDRVLLERVDPNDPDTAILILGVIEDISTGRSLGIKLTDLIDHPDSRLASKAIKLVAKTTKDFIFLKRFLTSPDPRFVANAVEALWDRRVETAVNVFKMFTKHRIHRARANAVVGLYFQGHREMALQAAADMLLSYNLMVVRSALWAVDFVAMKEILPYLQPLVAHPDADIRQRAAKTMAKLRAVSPAEGVKAVSGGDGRSHKTGSRPRLRATDLAAPTSTDSEGCKATPCP